MESTHDEYKASNARAVSLKTTNHAHDQSELFPPGGGARGPTNHLGNDKRQPLGWTQSQRSAVLPDMKTDFFFVSCYDQEWQVAVYALYCASYIFARFFFWVPTPCRLGNHECIFINEKQANTIRAGLEKGLETFF